MAGVTDVAFRTLAKHYGAAITYTEFVSSTALVRGSVKTQAMLVTSDEETPVAVQLFGNNLADVVAAAKMLEDDFDIIDINCGCPAWNVIRTGAGSELLKDPKKISQFVNTLASAVHKPVTVKIRTGIDDAHINALDVAKLIEDAGAAAITIHGRTQKQGYSGLANWEIIKDVKESVHIPVIGNGDVFTPEDYAEKLRYSNVDGVMIARGAMTNPYIFRQITDYMKDGHYNPANKTALFLEYLALAEKYNIPLIDIKNHAIQFTKGLEGGAKLREHISKLQTIQELKTTFNPI